MTSPHEGYLVEIWRGSHGVRKESWWSDWIANLKWETLPLPQFWPRSCWALFRVHINLPMKDKAPIMLLHNQRLGTSESWVANFLNLLYAPWVRSLKPKGAKTPFFSQGTMASAGWRHTVLLRNDGQAVACGLKSHGQCNIPPLDEGISYSQVSAGNCHTVLLRSDGQAVACGLNSDGRCSIPPLDEGLSYIQVSTGPFHTVLVRSDGQAVACGENSHGRCSIPPLDEGISYSQVSAGNCHNVLLRSDGQAVACGLNSSGRCNIPPKEAGVSYIQVSAGGLHTVLLRTDGQAVACGSNSHGQCSIPPLDEGLSYSQVSAGYTHTVLLRSDGQAVACGANSNGQCSVPPLHEGLSYSQVSAGESHTVLLRSDGQAVACGWNPDGQCSIPSLRSWREWFGFASPSYRYINALPIRGKDRVVQVDFLLQDDAGVILTYVGLDGLEVLRLKAQKSDRTVDVCSRAARELNTNVENLRMVLPDARLLATIYKANPFATLSDVISGWAKMASILWLRMGERVAKRMWNSIPMSSHRFRKVCMDMPCGGTMLAISTSHHPYLGVPVENVLTWEMHHGPSKWRVFDKQSPPTSSSFILELGGIPTKNPVHWTVFVSGKTSVLFFGEVLNECLFLMDSTFRFRFTMCM